MCWTVAQECGEKASQDDISMEAAGPSGLVNQMGDGNHLTTSRKNSDESCSPPRNNSFDDDMDGYRSDASDLINVSPLHSPKLPPSALVKYDVTSALNFLRRSAIVCLSASYIYKVR